MSERKVLNKYYPPDFDPTKIPKLRLEKNRQYSIRIMAPFNMKCNTCGEYIYKGKKFNSRKETVETERYLGLYIFRFYIKCPRCVAEIAFKTDPEHCDYTLEDGATRNFEAHRTAEEMAKREQKELEEEEANNPMKVLENRTKASQREMEALENLEELRDINSRHAKLDHGQLIQMATAYKEQLQKLQDNEDEAFIESIFGKKEGEESVKRLDDDDDEPAVPRKKLKTSDNPTDILTVGNGEAKNNNSNAEKKKPVASWQRSVGGLSSKSSLSMLVKKKQPQPSSSNQQGPSNTAKAQVNGTESTKKSEDTSKSDSARKAVNQTENKPEAAKPAPSGLGLLGNYSDSESNGTDSD